MIKIQHSQFYVIYYILILWIFMRFDGKRPNRELSTHVKYGINRIECQITNID